MLYEVITVALAKEYGTPLYVVSERMIRGRLREIRDDFLGRYPNTGALYASKALQTLDILRIVASEGVGLDRITSYNVCYTKLLRRGQHCSASERVCRSSPTASYY